MQSLPNNVSHSESWMVMRSTAASARLACMPFRSTPRSSSQSRTADEASETVTASASETVAPMLSHTR
eukprot:850754-Prymnesium_polylepis.2